MASSFTQPEDASDDDMIALLDDNDDEFTRGRSSSMTFDPTWHMQAGSVEVPEDDPSAGFSFRKLWAFTGPGFLMSIAYLDPGNIESDLQTGARGGYKLMWVLFWATVGGLFFQLMAARLGVVTGKHLAEVCNEQFSTPIRIGTWLMMEIAIIGSDIQEVIGSAIAINILSQGKIPLYGGVLITGADTFTFLLLEQYGLRKLELFFGLLISIMAGTFGYMYANSSPNHVDMIKGIAIPILTRKTAKLAVGMIGAVIMPHNLYLHSALVLSRKVDVSSPPRVREANFYYAVEGAIALLTSLIINLFVVGVFAKSFSDRDDAEEIDLLNAGDYLKEQFGTVVLYIWAVGLLAAGQSSTMTGTYAGQFVMEGFLNLKVSPWKRVLITRSVAIVPTVLVAVFAHTVLDMMDEWLNVLQSLQLPFAILPVLHFTSSRAIMGQFVNSTVTKALSWLLALVIVAANVYLVVDQVQHITPTWYSILPLVLVMLFYCWFTFYLALAPVMRWGRMKHIHGPSHKRGATRLQFIPLSSSNDPDASGSEWLED
eukprot:m.55370 g.55370  ORF g.55370 m.55370 type:complete len:541 (+) comp12526_c0_seq2:167-1789(+)